MEAYPIIITIILGTAVSTGYSSPVQPNAFQPDNSHIPQCMQPEQSGMCLAYFPSWYYHPQEGTCKEFIYGGCGGNSNRFFSFEECMKTCEGFKLTIDKDFKLKEEDSEEDICKKVAETGPCRAMLPRFYFNESGGKCELFMWGGCEGNNNNFVSIEECQEKCGPKFSEESKEAAEESKEAAEESKEPEGESEVESESNESSEEVAKNE